MNIVYATSNEYSHIALISLKSLLENNVNVDDIHVFYIGNDLSEENKKLLSDLVKSYSRRIDFYGMPPDFQKITGIMRANPIVYSYCYFQDILPDTVDKVLLVESDTLVLGDISELYNMDISDVYLAAADDMQSKWFKKRLGMKSQSVYFNSGILLINLLKMRQDNASDALDRIIQSGKHKYFYEVQDELNVFCEGSVKVFPPRFNCVSNFFVQEYKDILHYRLPSTCCSEEEFEQARSSPIIIHFTKGQFIQAHPWKENCTHPYKDVYYDYKRSTPLADEPLWKVSLTTTQKIISSVYRRFPHSIVTAILGIIHSFLYPALFYKLR